MAHLTDEALQAYLDGDPALSRREVEAHLHRCEQCRAQLAAYRRVYGELKREMPFLLSADFADRVIGRVAPAPSEKTPWLEWIGLAVALVAGLAAMVYFLPLSRMAVATWKIVQDLPATLKDYFPFTTPKTWELLFLAGLILLAVRLLDRLLVQVRR